nr:hypothetical protein HK105_003121 [Polyrhizophydium stewartii]
MDDPFADSMVSPFVRNSETQKIPPNSFVTFSWIAESARTHRSSAPDVADPNFSFQTDTSCGDAGDMGGASSRAQVFRSRVVGAQTSPSWHFQTSIAAPRTEQSLRTLKSDGHIDFCVYHVPKLNVARDGQSGIAIGPNTKKDLVGVARVPFRPLFGGVSEIHGWYPVKDVDGSARGQLLVRIFPSENLVMALKELGSQDPIAQPAAHASVAIAPVLLGKTNHVRSKASSDKSLSEAVFELDQLRASMQARLKKLADPEFDAPRLPNASPQPKSVSRLWFQKHLFMMCSDSSTARLRPPHVDAPLSDEETMNLLQAAYMIESEAERVLNSYGFERLRDVAGELDDDRSHHEGNDGTPAPSRIEEQLSALSESSVARMAQIFRTSARSK